MDQETEHRLLLEAQELTSNGRFRRALRLLDEILEAIPGHVGATLSKGTALELMGREEEAIALYSDQLRKEPSAAVAIARGNILVTRGRLEAALEDYETAIELEADEPETWIHKGDVLIALGRPEESFAAFEKAAWIHPQGFTELDWGLRGDMLLDEGFSKAAAVFYEKSKDVVSLHNLGNIRQDTGNHGSALEAFEAALDLEPDNAEILNDAGIALLDLDRSAEALEYFERVTELAPRESYGWVNKGVTLGNLRHHEAAVESLRRAVALDPEGTDTWVELGYNAEMLGDVDAAYQYYSQAIDVDGESKLAWNNLGYLHLVDGKAADALEYFDRAIEIDPQWTLPLANKIRALADLGQPDQALQLVATVDDESDTEIVAAHVGLLTDNLYRHQEALDILRDALARETGNALLRLYLPELLIKTERFDEARQVAEQLLGEDLTPSNQCVISFLAYIAILRGAGTDDERLASFDRFIDIYRARFVEITRRVEWVFDGLIDWIRQTDLGEEERFLLLSLSDLQASHVSAGELSYFGVKDD